MRDGDGCLVVVLLLALVISSVTFGATGFRPRTPAEAWSLYLEVKEEETARYEVAMGRVTE